MKKLLGILALAAVMTACNNESEKKNNTDASTSEASEAASTVKGSDSTKPVDNSPKK